MFVGIGDPTITHNVRAWDANGNVWKPNVDPTLSAYVPWVDADYALYRIPATPKGNSGRFYCSAIPSDAADWELCEQGATLADEEIVYTTKQTYVVPEDLTLLEKQDFDSVDVSATTGVHYEKSFLISGLDATDWEQFVFTLKRDKDTDEDSEAMLTVRVSNPADGATDGLLIKNGKPVDPLTSVRGDAEIIVNTVSPDTSVTLILDAAAMDLPPSGTDPFDFEIVYWVGGEKMPFASGGFTIKRSARRAIAAP